MTTGALVGIDIGGGGIRTRVQAGCRIAEHRHDGAVPRAGGRVDGALLCDRILSDLALVLTEVGSRRVSSLGIGMTGIPGLVDDPSVFDKRLRGPLGLGCLTVASDAVTTHLGALNGQDGAVVAAGTGVVTFGTDHRTIFHQVDGWGYALGDEGSGAWIGRAGLEAALRAADGRMGGSRVLYQLMSEQFGTPLDLLAAVYPSSSPGHVLASFAPAVERAARAGDSIAEAIWREAGTALGRAAVAALEGLSPRVSWGGNLFRAGELLMAPFREELLRLVPSAQLRAPVGSGLGGALLLARRAAKGEVVANPLHMHVFGQG